MVPFAQGQVVDTAFNVIHDVHRHVVSFLCIQLCILPNRGRRSGGGGACPSTHLSFLFIPSHCPDRLVLHRARSQILFDSLLFGRILLTLPLLSFRRTAFIRTSTPR